MKTRSSLGASKKDAQPILESGDKLCSDDDSEAHEVTAGPRRRQSHNYSVTGSFHSSHEMQAEVYIDNCRKYEVPVDPG